MRGSESSSPADAAFPSPGEPATQPRWATQSAASSGAAANRGEADIPARRYLQGVTEALLEAVRAGDLGEVQRLLDAGARDRDALPVAAERGPLELVEMLIRSGAIEWLPDAGGRTPLQAARAGGGADRDAIVELLDRPVIHDSAFRAAVDALHAGDIAALERLLDAEPRLLHERVREPSCYRDSGRDQYFLDPRLLWFVANNPTLVETMPVNIVEVARLLLVRGAEGLDDTLGLVMTSAPAREQGYQVALVQALRAAGATPTRGPST